MTSLSDKEKTRAFAQKMREEGAAGFAAGPWMSWEENGCLENPIIEGQVIPGDPHRHASITRNRKITGDRFFTWVVNIAVIALLAGIAGVYLTANKQTEPAPPANSESPTVSTEAITSNPWEAVETVPATVSTSEGTQTSVDTPPEPAVAATIPTTVDSWASTPTDIWAVPAETSSLSGEEPVSAEEIAPAVTAQVEMPAESTMEIAATEPAVLESAQVPAPTSEAASEQKTLGSAQTETPVPGKPTGPWQVNIESYFTAGRADRRLTELRAAEQTIAEVNGKTVYRLGVPGFESRKTAQAQGELLKQQHGLNSIWVNKP